jgi:hypothetical protein
MNINIHISLFNNMTDRSNISTESGNSYNRRLSMDEYSELNSKEVPQKQGMFRKGFNFLFRRSKSEIKSEGMINKSVPCYWHEQK